MAGRDIYQSSYNISFPLSIDHAKSGPPRDMR